MAVFDWFSDLFCLFQQKRSFIWKLGRIKSVLYITLFIRISRNESRHLYLFSFLKDWKERKGERIERELCRCKWPWRQLWLATPRYRHVLHAVRSAITRRKSQPNLFWWNERKWHVPKQFWSRIYYDIVIFQIILFALISSEHNSYCLMSTQHEATTALRKWST